jgi:quinoprotein glucose dehydrogenase
MFTTFGRLTPIAALLCLATIVHAAPPGDVAASGGFKAPPGWTVELFANEPQLYNPVAFCIDEQGRIFVAEEYRFNRGTEENRSRPFLLEDDLQIQTVADRLAMFKKWSGKFEGGMNWFSKYSDQVRLLEDRDGDGRAERSSVFAGGFNGPTDGLAAGVIARDGDVYLTCIPSLWLLKDTNGDGKADVRKPLITGFGVNAAFLGHDLHGLAWGPDGRLYFSVGDRGFHVETPDGKVHHGPRSGAVFRCDPDGSNFEVFARGLRNPQELAFDNYGRLFAVDNNCDLGDHARLVYVMEGGNSGWNMSYQTIPLPYQTGPWHAERMWHLQNEGQPAWIVPPVGKIGAGPSGFVNYPGVGLPARYRDHFFYCNYTSNGGVESFAVKPNGAGFTIDDFHPVVTPLMATDVDFDYAGKMVISEFGRLEWDGSNSIGRIYKVFDPQTIKDPAVAQTQALFKAGFRQRSADELAKLLSHVDNRVRQRAQFALAERGEKSMDVFVRQINSQEHPFARLHAIWGLGQIGRTHLEAVRPLVALLGDADPHVRAQAAKVIGETKYAPGRERLVETLRDGDLHVRSEAAIALGRLKDRAAIAPLFAMLDADGGRDPFLRHAGVMGLLGSGNLDDLMARADDPSRAIRMAIVLVLRRLSDPRVARFLEDDDLAIATEAARAINDVPIEAGTAALAGQLDRANGPDVEALQRRAINANFRIGGVEQAKAIARFAADPGRSATVRAEALEALGDWAEPPSRDRVNGFWRPLPKRDATLVRAVLGDLTETLLAGPASPMKARAIELGTKLGVEANGATFLAIVSDPKRDSADRLASLRRLAVRKSPQLEPALVAALASNDVGLRSEARLVLSWIDPTRAIMSVVSILSDAKSPAPERQSALATLATIKTPAADAMLSDWVARLESGRVPAEIQLDLIEAAHERGTPALRSAIGRIEAARSKSDPLAAYRVAILGGDAARGRMQFIGNRQAQCVRCHGTDLKGGAAAPDLTKVAGRYDRETLLQALIDPDARIADGFGTIALSLQDGRVVTGVLKSERDGVITVASADGRTVTVSLAEVDERSASKSAMPKMGTVLSPRELRDVVEYLSTLK